MSMNQQIWSAQPGRKQAHEPTESTGQLATAWAGLAGQVHRWPPAQGAGELQAQKLLVPAHPHFPDSFTNYWPTERAEDPLGSSYVWIFIFQRNKNAGERREINLLWFSLCVLYCWYLKTIVVAWLIYVLHNKLTENAKWFWNFYSTSSNQNNWQSVLFPHKTPFKCSFTTRGDKA